MLVDNLALAFSAGKGRSCNHAMLRVVQKLGALCLACNFALRVRWIPSEKNVSDGPSRGSFSPGYFEGATAATAQRITQLPQVQPPAEDWDEEVTPVCWGGKFEFRGQGKQEVYAKESGNEGGEGEKIGDSSYQHAEVQPSLESRTASKAGEDDGIGSQQCECGAAEPVRSLPQKIQGLVQGERLEVATPIFGRRNPCRLLRRFVPRGSIKSRGREDDSSFGIFRSTIEGQADEESAGPTGLAKAGSSQEQASITEAYRLWDRHEVVGNSEGRYGFNGASQLRLLPETRGGDGSCGKELGATHQEHRNTVPTLHPSGSGSGGGEARQNWNIQQLVAFGQSGHSKLVGESGGEAEDPTREKQSIVRLHHGQVYRQAFQSAGKWLGLQSLHTYQLRHGGASEDLSSGLRDHNAVKDRGRWRTDSSVRRYGKVGKLQDLLGQLQPWALEFCRRSVVQMERVVAGQAAPCNP